ncbi:hypothetical protein [Absidia glauca]|uniref:Uncharacterized protein n=1 Tax=Absidia glauca TaxID=4829 RepID=A0A163J3E2_ABSGL|nr:hypothetical protein [Absidia glauca]
MEIEPEIEDLQGDYDFYAATRSERPPEIIHDDKTHKKRKVYGPENEIVQEPSPPHVPMETDRPTKKPQRRKKMNQLSPDFKYNIADDVLSRKADIEVGDLIASSPLLKRQLLEVCRPKRQTRNETLNTIEEGEIVTTAAYAEVHVGTRKIKALIDCGAAKSCISRSMMKMLDMEIDAQSTSVFTLGNGTKQPTLGIVLDVPIKIGDGFSIPANMEVLPQCPAHLILGIDWLNHAQAIINIKLGTLTVFYKQKKMIIPITYIKASSKPATLKSSNMIYKESELKQTPQSSKSVAPLKDLITEDDESDEETEEEEWEHDEKEEEGKTHYLFKYLQHEHREEISLLENQTYEEKRLHWARLHTLKEGVVPVLISIIHQDLADSEDYQADLRRTLRRMIPSPTLRRMVYAQLARDDPWYLAGGPALLGVGDVAPPVSEAGVENVPPVAPDLFSSLLEIDQLFNWAMDPSVPSLGE